MKKILLVMILSLFFITGCSEEETGLSYEEYAEIYKQSYVNVEDYVSSSLLYGFDVDLYVEEHLSDFNLIPINDNESLNPSPSTTKAAFYYIYSLTYYSYDTIMNIFDTTLDQELDSNNNFEFDLYFNDQNVTHVLTGNIKSHNNGHIIRYNQRDLDNEDLEVSYTIKTTVVNGEVTYSLSMKKYEAFVYTSSIEMEVSNSSITLATGFEPSALFPMDHVDQYLAVEFNKSNVNNKTVSYTSYYLHEDDESDINLYIEGNATYAYATMNSNGIYEGISYDFVVIDRLNSQGEIVFSQIENYSADTTENSILIYFGLSNIDGWDDISSDNDFVYTLYDELDQVIDTTPYIIYGFEDEEYYNEYVLTYAALTMDGIEEFYDINSSITELSFVLSKEELEEYVSYISNKIDNATIYGVKISDINSPSDAMNII